MRLTLRTLLAYLDDTLEPSQARLIGQKVAESDAAQELIARIKQVTRRRRLTVPPATGPGAKVDANTIAEYLDNTLSPEQLAQVEEICLESDVHLAEMAACHQILTLVLGQPFLVPPVARERMHRLVKGRESIRRRPVEATPARQVGNAYLHDDETDEALMLGLPLHGKLSTGARWLIPLAAVLLLAVTGAALFMALPSLTQPGPVNPSGNELALTTVPPAPVPVEVPKPPENPIEPKKSTEEPAKTDTQPKPPVEEPKRAAEEPKKSTEEPKLPAVPPKKDEPTTAPVVTGEPSKERRDVGRYLGSVQGASSVLLQKQNAQDPWQRLKPGPESAIFTKDRLLSLPGYRSEIRLAAGIDLTLWGNLPEFSTIPVHECAVVLHANPGVDLDFTLEQGRVILTNRKNEGPARIRLRFQEQLWELTLQEPGSALSAEYFGVALPYTKEVGADIPLQTLGVVSLSGSTQVKVRYQEFAMPAPSVYYWENLGAPLSGPRPLPKPPEWWTNGNRAAGTAEAKVAQSALDELSKRLAGKAPVERALSEAVRDTGEFTRGLAVRCQMAVGNLPAVLDALDSEKSFASRFFAADALRHWLGLSVENDKLLTQVLVQQKKYSERQAETILQLLHGFTERDADPAMKAMLVEYLNHDRLPIRQLAHSTLKQLMPEGSKIPYDPAGETARRTSGYEQWRRLFTENNRAPKKP